MTAFVKRVCGLEAANARDILRFKEQLTRFAAASVRMAVDLPSKAYQINTYVIKVMELWLTKDERQRVLWPAYVELSPDYFENLTKHAVPLDERAIGALSNSPMALDVYAWLAQRLCRIPDRKSQLVTWASLREQFGQEYAEIRFFRRNFLRVLGLVKSQYPAARFEVEERGVSLAQSPPPVAGRVQVVCG